MDIRLLHSIANDTARYLCFLVGGTIATLKPTFPFLGICMLAVFIDCITAYRLGLRVKQTNKNADGKIKSEHASKIFNTFIVIYSVIILSYLVDTYIFPFIDLHLHNFMAGGFCIVQLVSILENESSQNTATWAIVAQKILADKSKRHLNIDIVEAVKEAKEENE